MRSQVLLIIIGSLLCICLSVAFSDTWLPPRPKVFASQWGDYGFKLLLPKKTIYSKGVGVLFQLDGDGKEKVVWRQELLNIPHRVFVRDDGKYVVTIDTYGNLGYDHSLVIYDEQGKVVKDLKLEDLLTADEIKNKVGRTVSSRFWTTDAEFSFDPPHLSTPKHFNIKLKWGRTVKLVLATGKVE